MVIPDLRLRGDVLGMYGRKITPNLREGTPLHLYLPGPHRGVWNEAGAERIERNHPVRVADRRADVLVRGIPQRDGELRRRTASPKITRRVSEARRHAASGSPTTATKPATRRPSG